VLGHAREFLVLELDAAGRGAGLAADQVQQRGLARAVGADDDAQLVPVDVQVQRVDGLEAVEGDRQVFRPA